MKSLRFIDRQAGYGLSAIGLLVAMVAPGLVPAFASADVVTERSITMSNASADADNVSYQVQFTASTANTTKIVLDFCSDSPIIGDSCALPGGFSAAAATVGSGFTVDSATDGTVQLTSASALDTSSATTFTLDGINNPTAAGSFYARILTYTAANATSDGYVSPTATGTFSDQGGFALATTDTIGVNAKVLETLTFCAAGEAISTTCANPTNAGAGPGGAWLSPNIQLGTDGILSSSAVSDGSIYTDISTNAASGAVVSLKSDTTGCGGLKRAGDTQNACDIGPASAGITQNNALFGVMVPDNTATTGTVRIAGGGDYYSASTYKMNYVAGDGTGVTSTYGDPILDTNGAPVNQGKSTLTFGASISDTTPAGRYSADLSLIATGKF